MRRVQHFLHQYPTSVPFLVLILGIAAFTIPLPRYVDRRVAFRRACRRPLLLRLQPLADPPAGHHHRHAGNGADAGDPDRRHRPVRRRDHDPLLGGDGPHLRRLWRAAVDRLSAGTVRRPGLRRAQRPHRHEAAAAAVHRDARHLEHLRRAQRLVLAQRDDPPAGYRGLRAVSSVDRHDHQAIRRHPRHDRPRDRLAEGCGAHLRLAADGAAGHGRLVHFEPHRLRPPHLCDRRRAGFGPPRRHQHRPHPCRRLRACRPDLRALPPGC